MNEVYDIENRQLFIGDKVFFSKGQGRELYKGEVISFKKEKVKVRQLHDDPILQEIFNEKEFYTLPDCLVKEV